MIGSAAPPALGAQAADPGAAVDRAFAWASDSSPGCAVAVAKDGLTVLARAYGMASLEHDVPFAVETVSDAASVSKQFTAAAVLLLVQDGKLSLDEPVRRHLPELPDYGSPVTIRQLLNHTSGLREWSDLALFTGWTRETAAYSNHDVLGIASRQRALNFAPGSEFSYSNTNFELAAILVGRVSGIPFAEFTRRRLFEPLGMSSTQWRDDHTRMVKRLASGYQPDGRGRFRRRDSVENTHGGGGLLTTVGDLLKWNEALAAGRVVSPELVRQMETPLRLSNGREVPYGLGLWLRRYRGVREVEHGGKMAGYRAFVARYPEQRVSVALLCNDVSVDPVALGHAAADAFLPGQLPPPGPGSPPPPTVALAPVQLAAKAGLYRHAPTGMPLRIGVEGGAWRFPGSVEFGAGTLEPTSPTTFVFAGGYARGEFLAGPGGEVQGMRVWPATGGDTTRFERVAEWTPTMAELGEFAGRYTSGEANGTFTVQQQGDRLLLMLGRPGRYTPLAPEYRDAFTSGFGVITFQRDWQGRITSLSVTGWLTRGVVFLRE
ncbi:MAG TPA: serine hydrolase domain-containing protein [Longimicrobiaceae bacterium]|nr:serine hydrolase domain-containing protein [Longimicrobiaceae bacterium]